MDDSEQPRKPGSPSGLTLLRMARWLSHQILTKDGGLLATLRGIVAAALLAVGVRAAQHYLEPSAHSWRVLTVAAGVVLVLLAVTYLLKRGRTNNRQDAEPEPERPGSASRTRPPHPHTVLEIHVRIHVDPGAGVSPVDTNIVVPGPAEGQDA